MQYLNNNNNIQNLLQELSNKIGGKTEICRKCGFLFYINSGFSRQKICTACKKNTLPPSPYYICKKCGKAVVKKTGSGKFCYTCHRIKKLTIDKKRRNMKIT